MTDRDVIELFGKSIFDMTVSEIIELHLDDVYTALVDEAAIQEG